MDLHRWILNNYYYSPQVFTNMQPLNVCLSHVGSMNIVEKISEGHDVEVQEWSDRLLPLIKNPSQTVHVSISCCEPFCTTSDNNNTQCTRIKLQAYM